MIPSETIVSIRNTMVSDGNYPVITIFSFSLSSLWYSFVWSYVLTPLPCMTSQYGKLLFLLGNIYIITRSLVVSTYFWKVKHLSLQFVTVQFGELLHLYGKFSIIYGSSLVRTYFEVHIHQRIIYFDIDIGIFIKISIICTYYSIIYCHIYTIPFDWLFLEGVQWKF